MKISPRLQSLFLLSVSLIASLILCEIGLRVLTPFPINKSSNKIQDDNLGYRMSSELADVDKWGFRNPSKTRRVLAAIGDSHTYGFNILSEESWPAVLQGSLGIPTYNFGVGSYGIYSYHALIRQSVAGKFKGAVIALYPPNDFANVYSSCRISRDSSFWNREIKRLSLNMPKCWGMSEDYKRVRIDRFLKDRTAVGSAFDHLVIDNVRRFGRNDLKRKNYFEIPNTQEFVSYRGVRLHMQSMDVERDEIKIIWSDFLKMSTDWSKIADEDDILLAIMIIPSKERLLYEYAKQKGRGELLNKLKDSVQTEVDLEARIIKQARAVGMPVESAIGRLLKAKELSMQKGVPLYPPRNGHPKAAGYAAYARSAHDLLRKSCDDHMDNPICVQTLAGRAEQISK